MSRHIIIKLLFVKIKQPKTMPYIEGNDDLKDWISRQKLGRLEENEMEHHP